MNQVKLISNPLIDKDTNTLRKTVVRYPKNFYKTAGTLPYSKVVNFEIPGEYNNLAQLFVKVTAITTGDNTNHSLYAGVWHFKRMYLQNKMGERIMTNTANYLSVRTDELAQSPINSLLSNAMEPSPTFNNTTSVFYVPFFAWFSDDVDEAIPTFYTEQLELVCEVSDSKEMMGMPVDITDADYELICVYHDDLVRKPSPLPMKIVSYDIFEEYPIRNNGTDAFTKGTLSCNYPVFVNHSMVKDLSQQFSTITNIEYELPNEKLADLDPRIAFSLASNGETLPTEVNMETNSTNSYYFSRYRGNVARSKKNTDFVTFTEEMAPCTIKISHAADATKYLYNICEYRNIIEIDSEGRFKVRVPDKLNLTKFYN